MPLRSPARASSSQRVTENILDSLTAKVTPNRTEPNRTHTLLYSRSNPAQRLVAVLGHSLLADTLEKVQLAVPRRRRHQLLPMQRHHAGVQVQNITAFGAGQEFRRHSRRTGVLQVSVHRASLSADRQPPACITALPIFQQVTAGVLEDGLEAGTQERDEFCQSEELRFRNNGKNINQASPKLRNFTVAYETFQVPLGPAMLTEAVGTLLLCFVWAKMRAAKCIPVHISFAFAALITVTIANIGNHHLFVSKNMTNYLI